MLELPTVRGLARVLWGLVAALLIGNVVALFLVQQEGSSIEATARAIWSHRLVLPFLAGVGLALSSGVLALVVHVPRSSKRAALALDVSFSPLAVPTPESVLAVREHMRLLDHRLQIQARTAEPNVIHLVDELIEAAVTLGTSDIHLQPLEEGTRVQFRVHGLMEDLGLYPRTLHSRLVTRLKVLSDLVTYVSDRPQDGHFSMTLKAATIDVRISVLPTMHGEKVVLRLLRGGVDLPELASLGFAPDVLHKLESLLGRPQGMMFLTGPTGSGKTTTIYSALGHIRKSRGQTVQIATIEDPVEYDVPFLTQTAVSQASGLNFAAGLRSILRQDPDVMMVGEIRDTETAQIAVQAGLTGHLVVTSVHANSASGVFNRLIEMGIEPFLLASATLACISQRLVRGLCPYCRKTAAPGPTEVGFLKNIGASAEGTFYEAVGCPRCADSGYLTRVAVFELLEITPALQELLQKRVATPEIEAAARAAGMVPLALSAVERAREGVTTLREVMRVAG